MRRIPSAAVFGSAFLALALSGCSATLYVTSRTNGSSAQTSVETFGRHSGPITLVYGNKTYVGRWLYMAGPGSFSLASAAVTDSRSSAAATSYGLGIPMQGNGSILMSAGNGDYLHCVFNYSQLSSTGLGGCRDQSGGLYDIQITR